MSKLRCIGLCEIGKTYCVSGKGLSYSVGVLTVFNIFVACHKHKHFVVSEICKNFIEFVMGIYIISAKLLSEFATLETLVKKFKLLLTVGSFAASHTLFIINFKIICVEFARNFFISRISFKFHTVLFEVRISSCYGKYLCKQVFKKKKPWDRIFSIKFQIYVNMEIILPCMENTV